MIIKAAEIITVNLMNETNSGIGRSVPAHVKLRFFDEGGRAHIILLDLPDYQVEQIFRIPNKKD